MIYTYWLLGALSPILQLIATVTSNKSTHVKYGTDYISGPVLLR